MNETAKNNKVFDYKAVANKISPRGNMKQDELVKCG